MVTLTCNHFLFSKSKNMKTLFIILTTILLVSCSVQPDPFAEEKKSDFPCVVTSISTKEQYKGQGQFNGGLYVITSKRADGSEGAFTSNIKYAVGDTITIGIDTTGAFNKVSNVATNPTTEIRKDTTSTVSLDSTNL